MFCRIFPNMTEKGIETREMQGNISIWLFVGNAIDFQQWPMPIDSDMNMNNYSIDVWTWRLIIIVADPYVCTSSEYKATEKNLLTSLVRLDISICHIFLNISLEKAPKSSLNAGTYNKHSEETTLQTLTNEMEWRMANYTTLALTAEKHWTNTEILAVKMSTIEAASNNINNNFIWERIA